MIDLKDLEYVDAISKAGGVKKAADSMGITQPALTRRIQNLERKFQLQLFDRQTKGMRLTHAGEMFLLESQKLLAHVRDFETGIANHKDGEGGHVSIGIKPGLEDAFFRRSLVVFTEKYPMTSMRITIDTTPILSEKLRAGQIDLALGALGYADERGIELVLSNELEFQPLFNIPLEVFVRKGHPILKNGAKLDTLFKYPLVSPRPTHAAVNAIKAAQLNFNKEFAVPHILVDDYRLVTDIVERTDMWSAIFSSSHSSLENKNKFHFLGTLPMLPAMEIGIVKRKTWSLTPAANNLIDIVKQQAARWNIKKN